MKLLCRRRFHSGGKALHLFNSLKITTNLSKANKTFPEYVRMNVCDERMYCCANRFWIASNSTAKLNSARKMELNEKSRSNVAPPHCLWYENNFNQIRNEFSAFKYYQKYIKWIHWRIFYFWIFPKKYRSSCYHVFSSCWWNQMSCLDVTYSITSAWVSNLDFLLGFQVNCAHVWIRENENHLRNVCSSTRILPVELGVCIVHENVLHCIKWINEAIKLPTIAKEETFAMLFTKPRVMDAHFFPSTNEFQSTIHEFMRHAMTKCIAQRCRRWSEQIRVDLWQ